MTPGEVRRLHLIIRTFLSCGLDELILKMRIALPLRLQRYSLFWMPNRYKDKLLDERLRLALQELGPVWIKFGQTLSARHDLFPPHIADRLALLQDEVAPFDDKLTKQQIEAAMDGLPVETWFDDSEVKPLVSISITQAHTAWLKSSDKEVVTRVTHPDVLPVIRADLRLVYRLIHWVPRLLSGGRRLRLTEVVHEYEKTLIDELNLLRESANAIQPRRNFEDNPIFYIPEIYPNYYSKGMMVTERIYGILVSNVVALEKNDTNMKLLAEHGVQVFFTQVFRDSFLHTDMYSGNIFVSYEHPENSKYIGINCGIAGSLNKEDKRYPAESFIVFFNRDYHKMTELHVNSGWVPPGTNVEGFEFATRTVCEPIFEKPLTETSFGHVLLNLFSTTRRFSMEVQP